MRSVLQPWQVGRLVLDIERVKVHRSLRVESIFNLKKDEPFTHGAYELLKPRKRSGDLKEERLY